MITMEKLYEGKAKILYQTDDPDILLTYYKDDATAFNAQKRGQIAGKGEINCTISTALFQWLESLGIPTHYIDRPSSREMRVKAIKIIPLEVVVRNIAAGSLCKQTGLKEGKVLPFPLVEFYLKDDALGDPLLTPDRIKVIDIASEEQVNQLRDLALQINQYLQEFFDKCQIILVDFKLEFGVDKTGKIYLGDEISPDTCRLWDKTQEDTQARILDKDRFRRDLGDVETAYQQVQARVLQQIKSL
ncbi:MAG: phosphoribosylaminoimidazolesuccinocarboxamide synthase [Microcystis wesenbergii Mw_MB_S_20031200_S109]|uniref:Phosphoribosylaminoimidazole-succinocarboxamide synthase n=1 Tax=Microcystis wesenbergii Mw_MB_S_20031200_S109D TaxID=2486241 RepID=A0A552LRW5_9CHRO|nr:phosphoribosylaminoimidazolesuccinocarboxamide synthase [Microcystis aeruginosa LG13-11]TRV13737.1 MAG: phosphoribosylaminoimidazolesuccinocarboxamide synthase [Microcystis wesenbergii Mw_MB_S_20031200_S109]TRV22965.1 MAG: phosphoribosylaminoimidazolesuccinocarboxamide synthase [Microcystis wesenbergii Mw_MB_S_20031200_S109D]